MTRRGFIRAAAPQAGVAAHRAEIDAAMARVLDGGRYILGDECEAFEREFAAWLGAAYAVGVASGTDALHLALRALGLTPGDEVVTVSHTAVGTVAAVEMAGAVAVLADIDPVTGTMDPDSAARAIGPRTRALMPVHLYGHPASVEPLRALADRHGLRIVEDCAQSHGAEFRGRKTGGFGDIAAFSFYPTKNLAAIGDGGAVVTSDPTLAERVRLLREYGWRERYVSDVTGFNSRLDELQASILRVRLRHLDADNAARRDRAARYLAALGDTALALPVTRPDCVHVYHQFVVRANRREALREHLRVRDVGTLVHYPVPVHLQPAYRDRLRAPSGLLVSERAAATVLSLPMYPELPLDDLAYVCDAIHDWVASGGE